MSAAKPQVVAVLRKGCAVRVSCRFNPTFTGFSIKRLLCKFLIGIALVCTLGRQRHVVSPLRARYSKVVSAAKPQVALNWVVRVAATTRSYFVRIPAALAE